MARIRLYQSVFNVPGPVQPAPFGNLGAPVLKQVAYPYRTRAAAGAMIATGCNQPELWKIPAPPTGWTITDFQAPQPRNTKQKPIEVGANQPEIWLSTYTSAPWPLVTLPDLPTATVNQRRLVDRVPEVFAIAPAAPPIWGWQPVLPDLPARPKFLLVQPDFIVVLPPPTLTWGWQAVLPDLPQFVRRQALPESAGRLDPPQNLQVGWNIVQPDLPTATARSRVSAAAVNNFLSLPLGGPTQPQGWNIVLPDIRFKQPQMWFANPDVWKMDAVAPQPWGWSLPPPMRTPPQLSGGAFAGATLTPQVIQDLRVGWNIVQPDLPIRRNVQTPQTITLSAAPVTIGATALGWECVLPLLPQFKRKLVYTEYTSRIDKPFDLVTGWTITLPDLPVRRKVLPPDFALIVPQPVPKTFFVDATLPLLPTRRLRLPPQTIRLVAAPVIQPAAIIYTPVVPPDLPTRRHILVPQTITLVAAPVVPPAPRGWQAELPLLRRTQSNAAGLVAKASFAGITLYPAPRGWECILPLLPTRPTHGAGLVAKASFAIPQSVPLGGFEPVLPDLRGRQNYFGGLVAKSSFAGRSFFPTVFVPNTLPDIKPRPRVAGGIYARTQFIIPQQAQVGFELVNPPVTVARRKVPSPYRLSIYVAPNVRNVIFDNPYIEPTPLRHTLYRTGPLRVSYQVPPSIAQVQPIVGWETTPPVTKQPNFSVGGTFAGAVPNLFPIIPPPIGWTVEPPQLTQPKTTRGAALAGATLTPQPVVQPYPVSWTVDTVQLRQPPTTRGAIFAGETRAPQQVFQPFPVGWSVVQPDLPAFRRKQALPEWTTRIDQPVPIVLPPLVAPTPVARPVQLRTPPVTRGAVFAGGSLAPQIVPNELFTGWSIVLPDLPFRRYFIEREFRLDQPVPVQIPAPPLGWSPEIPLLPTRPKILVPQKLVLIGSPVVPPPPAPPPAPPVFPLVIASYVTGSGINAVSSDLVIVEGAGAADRLTQRLELAWNQQAQTIYTLPPESVLPLDLTVLVASVIFDLSIIHRYAPIVAVNVLSPNTMAQASIINSPFSSELNRAVQVIIASPTPAVTRAGMSLAVTIQTIGADGRRNIATAQVNQLITDPIATSVIASPTAQVVLLVPSLMIGA